MKETKAYKCDYCGKLYRYGKTALNHEKLCKKNPENIAACSGCKHIEEIPIEFESMYYDDYYGGIPTITSKMFHCNKLNKNLYPAKAVRKKLNIRYPEQFKDQEQMPSNCDFWQMAALGDD